ncbi:MAG: hypothetical protein LBK57_11240 [Clostridiales Family XIII bacterium]|jgi:GH18 family chitinase|nr:hypothetical protein [Clostridiales Family XIII bacterium]
MLTKKNNILICTAVLLWAAIVLAPTAASFAANNDRNDAPDGAADGFKVIGYYCGEQFDVPVEKLQAEKLTHVIYGFLIPFENGSCKPLEEPAEVARLIEKCHSAGTEVYISVGGYFDKDGLPLAAVFEKIGADEALRTAFAQNVADAVLQYGFDGVELDWEYPSYKTGADYEKTVTRLSETLKPLGKGLSTALPGTGSTNGENVWEALEAVTDETVACFDFINLMCYDLMSDPNHSPIWFSKTSINYWKNFRNVPAEKLVLGMPLYARPSWNQYRDLVEMDSGNAYLDYLATTPLESSYNGLNTLREKTMIAVRETGGVMLFDVNEDTYDDTSVVSMIDDTLAALDGLGKDEINDYIWIIVDNKPVLFASNDGMGTPFIDENGRTLVPFRKLLESIGAEIGYNPAEGRNAARVEASFNGTRIILTIGSNRYSVNGKDLTMDTAAVIKEGRTYIPVRPALESFGYSVSYSEAGKSVYATAE